MHRYFLALLITFVFAVSAFAQSTSENIARESDSQSLWRAIANSTFSSSYSSENATSQPSADCQCPLLDPTTNDCPGCTKRKCGVRGCAKVTIVAGNPHVRTEECNWGADASCSCDPALITPPLPSGWSTACQKDKSNTCGSFRCVIYDQNGDARSTSSVPCGS